MQVDLSATEADIRALAASCRGVCLTGSPADINPLRYAAEVDPATSPVDLRREIADDILLEDAYAHRKPVLGICVGMQVLFGRGVERGVETEGLDQWPGVITELDAPILPHMGWNSLEAPADSVLFDGIADERFYFVHSYAATGWTLETMPPFPEPRLTWAEHGTRFLAAVENGPLSATQFHPEKSGEPGIRLLSNWLESL